MARIAAFLLAVSMTGCASKEVHILIDAKHRQVITSTHVLVKIDAVTVNCTKTSVDHSKED